MKLSSILKVTFCVIALWAISLTAAAQDSLQQQAVKKHDTIAAAAPAPLPTANKNVKVIEDTGIINLTARYSDFNKKKELTDGYRIQIMYTDVRNEAYKSKGQMYKDFPDYSSYVEYDEPYYKLRIGDFKTRLEATHVLEDVIILYPGAFIVKDKIKINPE